MNVPNMSRSIATIETITSFKQMDNKTMTSYFSDRGNMNPSAISKGTLINGNNKSVSFRCYSLTVKKLSY